MILLGQDIRLPFTKAMFSPRPTLFFTPLIRLKDMKASETPRQEVQVAGTGRGGPYMLSSTQILGPTILAAPLFILKAKCFAGQGLDRPHFKWMGFAADGNKVYTQIHTIISNVPSHLQYT